jgi:ferredoxin
MKKSKLSCLKRPIIPEIKNGKMSELKYPSLKEYYNDMARQAIEERTLCGECVRNCPVLPLIPIKDKAPEEITGKEINFLKPGDFSEGVLRQGL